MTSNSSYGYLQVDAISDQNHRPIPGATVQIRDTDHPETLLEETGTDLSGQTEDIELPAPPLEYSLNPQDTVRPYGEYTITVTAPGYEPLTISGSEILSGQLSVQTAALHPLETGTSPEKIAIPEHTLYGIYPPKDPEAEIKPVADTGEIVLSRVVIPQTIIVHDGTPSDTSAKDYYVPYIDYIKNVASSEIYATWPEATITANVLAIMSFTLNRIYTEWYRGKGYDFTITSSTAYDQKWIYGRNIFQNISLIVDEIFTNYLSRPNVKQPILTQYCDGKRVSCPGWMTQWGSMELGEEGYSAIEILRHFYGDNMYINTAEQISGIPASWPGYTLTIGSSGDKVRQLQEQLNAISTAYPAIPSIVADGIYGEATANAVRTFQNVFGLPQTGSTDYRTWYKISQIYVGVTRIAELS